MLGKTLSVGATLLALAVSPASEAGEKSRQAHHTSRRTARESGPVKRIRLRGREDRKNLARFVNGVATPRARSALRKLIGQFGHAESAQAVLSKEVPILGSENFRTESVVFDILGTNGELVDVPPMLYDSLIGPEAVTDRPAFARHWETVIEAVRDGRPLRWGQIKALRDALADCRADIARRKPAEARSWFSWNRARKYLRKLQGLVDQLDDPQRRKRIRGYVDSGLAYPGGTVGGLAEFVLEKNLSVVPGSEAQALLAELARDLEALAEADTDAHAEMVKDFAPRRLSRSRRSRRVTGQRRSSAHSWSDYGVPRYRWYTYRYSVPISRTRTYTYYITR